MASSARNLCRKQGNKLLASRTSNVLASTTTLSSCNQTWDFHSCMRRVFVYHNDGKLVVCACVCKNGHVSGAWTD
ncbi:hypothetical protein MLD38_028265 [Melastoma candidum]|uniref:Uncharacterized protein n=1 Tax=Melastoma candidum TaxID=119954 RepID=A0ACB9N1D6_9MYRT|nr:hypothetical protein MLD38_028265 [Melastoma candidum]